MKNYKQAIVVLAVGFFIVPQVAFAAWWNPLSWSMWNIFRPIPKVQQVQIATTTPAMPTATTTKKTEANVKQEKPKDTKDSLISSLKKQVADLTQKANQSSQPKVEAPKTSVITLPSGAVVEMDANGNVIRTITAAPQQTYTAPAPTTQTTAISELKISNVKTIPTINKISFEWDTTSLSEGKIYITKQGESSPQIVASFSGVATHHTTAMTAQPETTYSYTIESIMGDKFAKLNGTISTPALPKPTCTLTAATTTNSAGSVVGTIEWTTNLDPSNPNHSAFLTGNSAAPGRALVPIIGGSISGFSLSNSGPTTFEMAAHDALYSLTTRCSASVSR